MLHKVEEVWKNDWDQNVEGDAIVCVCTEEVLQALNEIKTGKDSGHSHVSLELISATVVGIQVMAEICQSPR